MRHKERGWSDGQAGCWSRNEAVDKGALALE